MMTLREWMEKHEIRELTVVKKLQELVGEKGCTEFAVRKWITGERIPRPKMQLAVAEFTTGAVTPNDWVFVEKVYSRQKGKKKKKKLENSKRSNR